MSTWPCSSTSWYQELYRLTPRLTTTEEIYTPWKIEVSQGFFAKINMFIPSIILLIVTFFLGYFRNLKLELLTQFPASNDEKISLFMVGNFEIELLHYYLNWESVTKYFMDFSGVLFVFETCLKPYCRSGNIREVLIFARRTNSRIQESHENYCYIIIALLEKNENSWILNFVKRRKIGNSRKFKHAKMTGSTVYGSSCIRVNPHSAGINFIRQNLILTSKVDSRALRIKIFIMALDP